MGGDSERAKNGPLPQHPSLESTLWGFLLLPQFNVLGASTFCFLRGSIRRRQGQRGRDLHLRSPNLSQNTQIHNSLFAGRQSGQPQDLVAFSPPPPAPLQGSTAQLPPAIFSLLSLSGKALQRLSSQHRPPQAGNLPNSWEEERVNITAGAQPSPEVHTGQQNSSFHLGRARSRTALVPKMLARMCLLRRPAGSHED